MSEKAMKLAMEAVYEIIIQWDEGGGKRSRRELARRIVALAEQPAQKCSYPYCGCNSKAWCKVERNEALDKKAENARELGLDYEPAPATELREQEPVAHAVIAGALFDFMGWLTSRKERLVLSSADNASPAVEAIIEFAKMRGLSLNDAKVQDWNTSPPAQRKPLTDEEARKLIKVGPVYAPDGVVTRSPIAYRKELEEAGLRGLRKGEAAHNIKENT